MLLPNLPHCGTCTPPGGLSVAAPPQPPAMRDRHSPGGLSAAAPPQPPALRDRHSPEWAGLDYRIHGKG